jgi:WD40 repeat protein
MKRSTAAVATLAIMLGLTGHAVAATPGSRIWSATTSGYASFQGIGVSPDGSKVFVAGTSANGYLTTAYDSATGAVAWSKTFGANSDGDFTQLAVGAHGTVVFVTGISVGATTDWDFGTLAYEAATGQKLWFKRFDGSGGQDYPAAIAASPDGSAVVVTGLVAKAASGYNASATVAYAATSGAKLWSKIYDPAGSIFGNATDAVVTRDGLVVVTGSNIRTTASGSEQNVLTAGYDLTTGNRGWLTRSKGSSEGGIALALSPAENSVYVTGWSLVDVGQVAATWAYATATGEQRWRSTVARPKDGTQGSDITVSPDGAVFVGAMSSSPDDLITIAYGAVAGKKLWSKRYDGPAHGGDSLSAIAVSPDGTNVFVTGPSDGGTTLADWATIAYDPASGAVRWAKRLSGSTNDYDFPIALAVSPDSTAVYVTGFVNNEQGKTIAYAA